MKIVFLGDKYKQLNRIHKNCLKKTESVDYIDEEDSEKNFAIYENESLLGMIETCLAEDKAGLQMVRFKIENKSWIEQRQILKAFIDYIWNFESINHIVLAIHVNIDGSGLEEDILRHLGFVGSLSFGGGRAEVLCIHY